MPRRTYLINAGGRQHKIQLYHNRWTGRKTIKLDDVTVEDGGRFYQYDSLHRVLVKDAWVEISVSTNTTGFSYCCIFQHELVRSEEDKHLNKPLSKHEEDVRTALAFWREFGRLSGLKLVPPQYARGLSEYRFLGFVGGSFVVFCPVNVASGESIQVKLRILARCDVSDSLQPAKKKIAEDLRQAGLDFKGSDFVFDGRYALLYMPYDVLEHPAFKVVEQLQKFVSVIRVYAQPHALALCEGLECKKLTPQQTRLVFINDNPNFLCPDCIDDLPNLGLALKKVVDKTPTKMLIGITYALGASFAASIAWALLSTILYLTNSMINLFGLAVIVGSLLPLASMFAFLHGIQKNTLFGFGLSIVIGLSSIVLGVYAFNIFTNFYLAEFAFQPDALQTAWLDLLEMPESRALLAGTTLLGIMIIALAVYYYLRVTRRYQKAIQMPEIEIIPDSWRQVGVKKG